MHKKIEKIFDHPVISAVIAGLILSFISWIGGMLPQPGTWTKLLTDTVSIPLWIFLIVITFLLCASLYILIIVTRHFVSKPIEGSEEIVVAPLSDNAIQLLRLFREADERCLYHNYLEHAWLMSKIQLEAALDELQTHKLMEIGSIGGREGTCYCLTEEGLKNIT